MRSVRMLGVDQPLRFTQQDGALMIEPPRLGGARLACSFRIDF